MNDTDFSPLAGPFRSRRRINWLGIAIWLTYAFALGVFTWRVFIDGGI